ncbi:MAG TPA: threonine--tRNA ligase [Candidatus Dormibacteraeota bacterium]|nr:threonine--tRNA ligase [Candidatus Dormibacteraeota bacterium]
MPDDDVDDALEAGLPLETPTELSLDILRHSGAHLLAAAVVDLFDGAQYDVGPAISEGFFYNFRLPEGRTFSEDDLVAIEARMTQLVEQRLPFVREVMTRGEARKLFESMGQSFKVDIIDRMADQVENVGIYRTGDFIDLCRGPHVPDTGWLGAVRLLRVAGVYWRGDERNEQLQRIYGTAWFEKADLDAYLERLAEAERRDHRRLGRDLDLFSVSEELGGGLVLWHPRGGVIRNVIEDYWRDAHRRGGYDLVFSPHIAQRGLWETSGHVNFFAESMYGPMFIDERPYQLKPMNCPFHILIYKGRTRSYRDLPLRFAELGTVYRYERSGVLHGLLRVRGFTQDDAHIFCRPDQIDTEIGRVVDFCLEMFNGFGFSELAIYLSTKPEKAQGRDEDWRRAEAALENQLLLRDIAYTLDEGGGSFYGPKIDMKVLDALGREWQCATVQFDFTQPENFSLEYVAEDGSRHRPVMVHRALLGSMERFFGVLVEHYAGHFPLWLAPTQCEIVPVQDDVPEVLDYAAALAARMDQAGLRAAVSDKPGERMQARIRDAELLKVPYIVVVGRRDVERGDDVVNVRDTRRGGQENLPAGELVERLAREVAERRPA